MNRSLSAVADRLTDLSRDRFVDPYRRISWPEELSQDAWYFSPELIAGRGVPAVEELAESDRMRLSLCEALNFFSLNIHGEKLLLQGLAARLHEPRFDGVTAYLQHFIDEENKHLHWFGEFCRRYGRVYPTRHVPLPSAPLPTDAEDFLFFARILVFEEIVDAYNHHMAGDERLAPVARLINLLHHEDETRHRAFGRQLVRHLWSEGAPDWTPDLRSVLAQRLEAWLQAVWRDFYNPDVFRDAGLAEPHALMREAWGTPRARRLRHEIAAPVTGFLIRTGALASEAAA